MLFLNELKWTPYLLCFVVLYYSIMVHQNRRIQGDHLFQRPVGVPKNICPLGYRDWFIPYWTSVSHTG